MATVEKKIHKEKEKRLRPWEKAAGGHPLGEAKSVGSLRKKELVALKKQLAKT